MSTEDADVEGLDMSFGGNRKTNSKNYDSTIVKQTDDTHDTGNGDL